MEHAIVSVDQNDDVKLDGRSVSVDELENAVRELPPERKSSLALQADKKASFGTIVKVMIRYRPPAGAVGATIARLLGEEPEQQIIDDLFRFKQLMEGREMP